MSEINTLAGDTVSPPAAEAAAEITFADLGLAPELLRAVLDEGYTKPTPIQAQAIPLVLAGGDLMAARPDRHRQDRRLSRCPSCTCCSEAARPQPAKARPARALILAPTRELAIQVVESVQDLRQAPAAPLDGARSAASTSTRRSTELQDRRRHPRRHPRPPARPRREPGSASTSPGSRSWSSTKPTACSTWASSPTSSAS